MRNFLMILVLLVAGAYCMVFAVTPTASEKTSVQVWQDYKDARATAKAAEAAGDFVTASSAYLTTEIAALALVNLDGTPYGNAQGIADWDRNNAGYMMILSFQTSKNPDDLRQALKILKERAVTTDASEKVQKNIDYCKETLRLFKSVEVK